MKESNPVLRYKNAVKKTRKEAIHAKCASCMGCTENSIEKGFRSEIAKCSCHDCPLYEFRPFRLNLHDTVGSEVVALGITTELNVSCDSLAGDQHA